MLDFPAELDRRSHPRVPGRLECEVCVEGRVHEGHILDASPGGFFVRTPAEVPPGTQVALRREGFTVATVVVHREDVPLSRRLLLAGGLGLRLAGR